MSRYIRFVLRFRVWVLAAFAAITVFFAWNLSQTKISSTPRELFFSNNSQYDRYLERMDEFGGDSLALIGFSGSDLLTSDKLNRLKKVVAQIEADPEIRRVDSLASAQNIQGVGDDLFIEYYADLFAQQPQRQKEFLDTITTDHLTRDWLITPDGQDSVVAVELSADERSMEASPAVLDRLLAAFEKYGFPVSGLHTGGIVAVFAYMMDATMFTLEVMLPLTVVVLFAAVFFMFQRFWPVVLTFIISVMAVTWTVGLGVVLYGHINIFTTMVPGLILVTCFADVLHLCSSYLLEISLGREKQEAILLTGKEVGTACGYTSATTFCGFVSLMLVPSPVFKQLGLLMGFGVSVALFMALTMVPIFFSYMPSPKPWKVGVSSATHRWLERFLDWTAELTRNRPVEICVIFFFLFGVCCYGFSQVKFETQFSKRFAKGNPVQVGLSYFNDRFPGTGLNDIYLEFPNSGEAIDPQTFEKLARFEAWLEDQPHVDQALSVVDLVRKVYGEINPKMAAENPLPQTREGVAQLLLLFEMSGGENLERFIDTEQRTVRFNTRLRDIGVIEAAKIGESARQYASNLFPGQMQTESFSLESLLGDWVDNIVAGQRNGLVFAFLAIAIWMVLATRSIKIGLLSMFPNILPLLVLVGYTGFFWDVVDTDTMSVLMVAIGIGVDDTIHFFSRFRFEAAKTSELHFAIKRTFHYSGRAIVITSVILVAGFAPFGLNDYFSVKIFGTMLPISLAVALAADLFWVPAMAHLGWIRFPMKRADA